VEVSKHVLQNSFLEVSPEPFTADTLLFITKTKVTQQRRTTVKARIRFLVKSFYLSNWCTDCSKRT